jgi:hypothetical protein
MMMAKTNKNISKPVTGRFKFINQMATPAKAMI